MKVDAPTTTAYLMTYTEQSCAANCAFCSQARESLADKNQLSRVLWPEYLTNDVLDSMKQNRTFERVCIQVINYPGFVEDTAALITAMKKVSRLPVSVDTCPIKRPAMQLLKNAGAERIGIPLDAATPKLFDAVKGRGAGGPYRWETHMATLQAAKEVFGSGMVMTNLIVGLGETEREATSFIQNMADLSIGTALFAFTPLKGTPMSERRQPPLESYRRIQIAKHLINEGRTRSEKMTFSKAGRITGFGVALETSDLIGDGSPLRTSGCPGCNRPYYNERPRGPIYNYPRPLTSKEIAEEKQRMEESMK
jgi:biotin synthase